MNAPQIPRKPVGEPAPAHVKEVDSQNATTESGWDIPDEGQKKKKYIGFGSSAGTGADAGGAKLTFSNRLDRVLSPHKRYFGRSRRTLLIVIGVAFLCLLGLIIGLAVGLSGGEKYVLHNLLTSQRTDMLHLGPKTYHSPVTLEYTMVN
jgi:hypothetical protein